MDPTSSSLSIPNPLHDHVEPATASSQGAGGLTSTGSAMNTAEDIDGSNKRAAFAGQWRTPENLLFPAPSTSSGVPPAAAAATSAGNNTTTAMVVDASSIGSMPLPLQGMELPDSTEDYAKALQEAYRRGAEAAAALAAQQQQFQLAPSASCPDFYQAHAATAASTTASGPRASPPLASSSAPGPQPAMTTSGVVAAHAAPAMVSAPTMTTSMSHPVLTSHTLLQAQPQGQHPQPPPPPPHQQLHPMMPPPPAPAPSAASNMTVASAAGTVPQMPPPPSTHVFHAAPAPMAAASVVAPPPPPPAPVSASTSALVRNSMSMPNMQAGMSAAPGMGLAHHPNPYHAGLVEEEKRLKRLARNRASARLRRLRKKNLVDAYETEVGILEKTLHALKHHEWGTTLLEAGGGASPSTSTMSALTEALSMDRGQQALNKQESKDAALDILRQQLEFVSLLEQIMQEQFVLHQVGTLLQGAGDVSGDAMESDGPSRALLQELVQELQLTPEQMLQLQSAQSGWEEEYGALQTVKQSLEAMINSNWVWNEGSTAVAEEFMNILHKNQVSKFLLWADANVEAIDELDGVNAPAAVPQGPVFTFGVNNNPESLLDDERA